MCGIVGGWSLGDVPAGLGCAIETLAHRGPDSRGEYLDPTSGMALGHTRLAIIDLSRAGAQPMPTDDSAVVITFNGEIYNYRGLRAPLEANGVSFRGHSDTEVLRLCRNSVTSPSMAFGPTPIRKPASRTGSLQTRPGL